jgi:beta-glucosidase
MSATDTSGSAKTVRAFPEGFVWGAATAAYQIEGAVTADGRGPSVWDTFSHTPGKVRGGDTGDVACDFYNRSEEDLDLMKSLGLAAFRFSISWSRIQPTGSGAINQAGINFYRRLVDGLREREIAPAITLFHWDLPQGLEDAGGWANRDTAERFADYAQIMAEAIGPDCDDWMTLNEPQVVANQGYRLGIHAPGVTDDAIAAATTHHLLLGHGLAVQRLRSALPAAKIGLALNLNVVKAADSFAEAAAVIADAEQNRIFMDPILHGSYPAAARPHMLPPESLVRDGDMDLISAPLDFIGINYYAPFYLKRADGVVSTDRRTPTGGGDVVPFMPPHLPTTAMGWLVEPQGLYEMLKTVSSELSDKQPGCRLYITENGCAAEDYVDPNGVVNDIERIAYLKGHLDAIWRAIQDGVPLDGYFQWSLLDNFEWAYGYQKRFGVIFVDFGTQKRTLKQSARIYQQIATTNELPHEWAGEDVGLVAGAA